ncbi:hypothetical protein ACH4S8_37235 [Streptomyces sp. NPDC021080]|uniref:hypothetical protein n=1 Tax=Streptomyces sp. NPDC021080 TaxID=3365110 RepID=UPI0037BD38DE
MSRVKHRKGSQNTQILAVDTSGFEEGMTFWATDATVSIKEARTRLAFAPSTAHGHLDGPARLMALETDNFSTPQLELLGALSAHTLAVADGEQHPVIFTDFQAAEHLLASMTGAKKMRPRRARNHEPLPQLVELIEALGDQVERVRFHWLPRSSTTSLQYVDRLIRRRDISVSDEDEHWGMVTFEDVLAAAWKIVA